ncbi:hypothetical protein P4571_08260 [Niallia alba]|uniref:hypothetical protein n=1 Tax=Niallia alba TaxID=2729105 RepID=UPI002E1B26F2|nr:hypothetical protein [Niallia alba]
MNDNHALDHVVNELNKKYKDEIDKLKYENKIFKTALEEVASHHNTLHAHIAQSVLNKVKP